MFENSTAKASHKNKINRERKYNLAEMESRKNKDAYRRFLRKPYYMEKVNGEKENGYTGCD